MKTTDTTTKASAPETRTWQPEPRIYKIIRFRFNGSPRTIRSNVTLTEAQNHCKREDTHGERAGVRWFDGYDYMKGYKPVNH